MSARVGCGHYRWSVLSGFGKIDRRSEIEVPGEEFFNAVDRMVRNTGQDVRQIGFRIDPVQFRRADQAVDCSGPLPADVGSSKQVVLTIMQSYS